MKKSKNKSKNSSVFPLIKAPGLGLLAVTTGAGTAKSLMSPFFGEQAYQSGEWGVDLQERVEQMSQDEDCDYGLIGIPSDCGGGICRGAAHGPLHLRKTLYQEYEECSQWDLGDIPCIPHLLDDGMLNADQLKASGKSLWGEDYQTGQPVSPLNLLEEFLVELWTVAPNFRPLVLGGDHSVSGPVFNAMQRVGKLENLAVLHFDAHTDLLEERYGVANCFATWTAHALRKLDDPSVWVQLGIRASGKTKKFWEDKFGLKQHWAEACMSQDPEFLAYELVRDWKDQGCTQLYITNDIDGTDASFAPSTGTPEYQGLDAEWVRTVIRKVTTQLPLVGADLTEVAPVLGTPEDIQATLDTSISFLEALQWSRG